ncbi:hypothetical protein RJD39_16740 [Vibrio scophthalmi]|uniref:Membrane protein n=1 Tax=Vibrio scophthalmi LMG 19158 TaxID=870967 RepID=F9RT25_9VIBR|nr:hypothetical protein [Vibrio scophthalmi]EGU31373.1 membrane protein [Vibrio scophthalmi LMG 19158]MCY9804550.1 hypothetical protein [Vibrio scophthalmi]
MNKAILLAVITACVGVSLFVSVFSIGANIPVYQWPIEALHGLAFTFAWGLGFPKYLAYLAGIVILGAVTFACYVIGQKFAKLIWRE